jgi:hypothetical protein
MDIMNSMLRLSKMKKSKKIRLMLALSSWTLQHWRKEKHLMKC